MFPHLCSVTFLILFTLNVCTTTGFSIGEECHYDDQCYSEHLYCKLQRNCQCKDGYKADDRNQNCVAMIGAECKTINDCSGLQNSNCISNVCTCSNGYMPDPSSSTCIQGVTSYNGTCSIDAQCIGFLGLSSQCKAKQCQCLQNYHPDTSSSWCLHDQALGQSCVNNSMCFLGYQWRDYTECRDNRCACKAGYSQTDDAKCTSDAKLIHPSSWAFLTIILVAVNINMYKTNYNI